MSNSYKILVKTWKEETSWKPRRKLKDNIKVCRKEIWYCGMRSCGSGWGPVTGNEPLKISCLVMQLIHIQLYLRKWRHFSKTLRYRTEGFFYTGISMHKGLYTHLQQRENKIIDEHKYCLSTFGKFWVKLCPEHYIRSAVFSSQSYVTTDGQPASLSWNKAPIWGLRSDLDYFLTVEGFLVWGALSDERTNLPFAIATGPRQRSHFRVRVP
jgi:hypothetical protein